MTASGYLRDGKFEVISHRGGSLEAPENTMAAFEHSINLNHGIILELDVNLSKDGTVVVIHDETVDRTTNGTGRISDLSWSEIQKLDGGFHFTTDGGKNFPFRNKGFHPPSLEEVLKAFPKTRMSIEIKHASPAFEAEVVKIVRSTKAQDRVALASENHQILVRARGLGPEMCSGFSGREVLYTLIAHHTRLPIFYPRKGSVFQIPLSHNRIPVFSQRLLRQAHGRGKHVHVWTINDEATMRYLIGAGVDGIITDAPSLLLSVATELKKI